MIGDEVLDRGADYAERLTHAVFGGMLRGTQEPWHRDRRDDAENHDHDHQLDERKAATDFETSAHSVIALGMLSKSTSEGFRPDVQTRRKTAGLRHVAGAAKSVGPIGRVVTN